MASEKKWVELGRVLREWGVRGELKCICHNTDSPLFSQLEKLYFEGPQGFEPRVLVAARRHDQYWRLKFKGLDSPEAAKAYRGWGLALPREELPPLPAGEIYLTDLEGLKVRGPGGESLGRVLKTQDQEGAVQILVGVDPAHAGWLPYEGEFIAGTQRERGEIHVTPQGLELLKINL